MRKWHCIYTTGIYCQKSKTPFLYLAQQRIEISCKIDSQSTPVSVPDNQRFVETLCHFFRYSQIPQLENFIFICGQEAHGLLVLLEHQLSPFPVTNRMIEFLETLDRKGHFCFQFRCPPQLARHGRHVPVDSWFAFWWNPVIIKSKTISGTI